MVANYVFFHWVSARNSSISPSVFPSAVVAKPRGVGKVRTIGTSSGCGFGHPQFRESFGDRTAIP